MSIAPKLGDGESFVAGRSIAKARELVEAAEAAGLAGSVITVSHGYVVPTSILADTEVEAEAEEGDDEFDPSEATVVEVKAYLDGADEAERERVLAAETDGKNREGVLSYTPKESK
jgi:hypothetical protein